MELWICDDPDRFLEVAENVRSLTDGKFAEKVDGLDESYWDLIVDGDVYTIHRQHYLGVSIFSSASRAKEVLERVERELKL